MPTRRVNFKAYKAYSACGKDCKVSFGSPARERLTKVTRRQGNSIFFKAGAVDCFEYHKHSISKTATKVYIQCDQLITAPEGPIRVAQ
jgi:hypothetical protein